MRPSLTELAALHVERRLTKKERNAELRQHGYDPDGDDGRTYRRAYATARQSRDMARFAGQLASGADAILLWELPGEDWPDAVAAGLTDMPLAALQERLTIVERELIAAGRTVVRVRATAAQMLAALAQQGWPNDQAHRAAALHLLRQAAKE